MDENKLGNIIIKLRHDNNLTQKELANILNVTYQAVSKWENNKSIPDIMILKEISNKFNIPIATLLNVSDKKTKPKHFKWFIIVIILIILGCLLVCLLKHHSSYEFKELTTSNNDFNIKGIVAYSKDKSSIYISDISYKVPSLEEYTLLECRLYHRNGKTIDEISKCDVNRDFDKTTLNDLLENITFKVDNWRKYCIEDDLYLEINAKNDINQVVTYSIPLAMSDCK